MIDPGQQQILVELGKMRAVMVGMRAETKAELGGVRRDLDRIQTWLSEVNGKMNTLRERVGTLEGTERAGQRTEDVDRQHSSSWRQVVIQVLLFVGGIAVAGILGGAVGAGRLPIP